jgi:phosphotriesterase-related protein
MATVETVRGAVDTADLGRTYMHEHVFVLSPDVQQNYPAEWGSEDDRVAMPSASSRLSPPRGSAASLTPPSWAWGGTSPVFSASPIRCPN